MAVPRLSTGVIEHIYEQRDDVKNPVLQCLSVKMVSPATGGTAPDRYRLILSDGTHYMQAMLATQLNFMIHDQLIGKNTIVALPEYRCNMVSQRRIVVCLAVTVVQQYEERIGTPTGIEIVKGGQPKPRNGGDTEMEDAKPDPKPKVVKPAPSADGAGGSGAYKQSQPKRGAGGGAPGGAPIYPIGALSPYQNRWTIKARVTSKTDIKTWSNARGEGKLFSVNLLDETGEIRATGFNDAVDNLYHILEEGKVYFISQARVNIAKKQFSNLNNEYELTFETRTVVEPCDDAEDVPNVKFSFVELGALGDVKTDSTCDVLAVVKEVGELGSIVSKATQRNVTKRELTLVDQSAFSVRLTLWGKSAENFNTTEQPVIAFKGVRVGDFGGRSLSMISSSTMVMNPDIDQAHALRGWFDASGGAVQVQQYSGGVGAASGAMRSDEFKCIEEVKNDSNLGHGEKPDYFNVRATVMFIKDALSYPACPTEKCGKKLLQQSDDSWYCEKCSHSYDGPEYRYMLQLSVGDHTGQLWLSAFNDVGQLILGRPAGDLEALRNEDPDAFAGAMQAATIRAFDFGCRAKVETYQDVERVKYQVMRAHPINYPTAGLQIAEIIRSYG